jgi:hypothetical protein
MSIRNADFILVSVGARNQQLGCVSWQAAGLASPTG